MMNETMLAALTGKNDKYACELTEKIIKESRESEEWYDYFQDFVPLLRHPKSLVRNRALTILASNAQWDTENRFDQLLPEYLSHITDEKPITARVCIQTLPELAQAKPQYIPVILRTLEEAELSKYKDSMRPLIEKDIQEVKRILSAKETA